MYHRIIVSPPSLSCQACAKRAKEGMTGFLECLTSQLKPKQFYDVLRLQTGQVQVVQPINRPKNILKETG